MRSPALLTVLALNLVGCGVHRIRTPVTGGLEATAGCYRLFFGSWVPAFPSSAHLDSLTPPSTIQLRAGGDVTPRWAFLAPPFNSLPGHWRLRGTDSLIVTWDAGEMGVEMHLTSSADSLAGYATLVSWHSAGPDPPPSATVGMRPVSCP